MNTTRLCDDWKYYSHRIDYFALARMLKNVWYLLLLTGLTLILSGPSMESTPLLLLLLLRNGRGNGIFLHHSIIAAYKCLLPHVQTFSFS